MKATNQKNMWHNNNSLGLRLLACTVFVCMGVGSSTADPGDGSCITWGNTCNEADGPGIPIAGDGAWWVFTDGATDSFPPSVPCMSFTPHDDVWISWTPTYDGFVTIDACDFDEDTFLAVYKKGANSCPLTTPLACNDDSDTCGADELQSVITFNAVGGIEYLIRLGVLTLGRDLSGRLFISTVRPGACCMPDYTCNDGIWVTACSFLGGSFKGSASTCAGSICTPVSNAFTYQGKLMDNGVPVNDTADMIFYLYDAATDGHVIGVQSVHFNVPVVDGLFTLTVNEQDEFGPNAFIGAARWLYIGVRVPAGSGVLTPLTPRQAITAAPFSKL